MKYFKYFNVTLSSIISIGLIWLLYAGIKYENIAMGMIAIGGMVINFFMLKHDISMLKA